MAKLKSSVFFVLVFMILSGCLLAQDDKATEGDQVVVYATVHDKYGRAVSELKKENFKLYEGKEEKQITYFSDKDEPASIGFLIDTSGSMTTKTKPFAQAVSRFMAAANSDNEYFAMTFADTAKLTTFSKEPSSITDALLTITGSSPVGDTRLFDSIGVALQSMGKAKYSKKALIIFSDLEENSSKIKFDQLKWLVRESNVILYIICVYDLQDAAHGFSFYDPRFPDLVKTSGGEMFFLDSKKDIIGLLARIKLDLQYIYKIGFNPSFSRKKERDEWLTFDLKVDRPNMKKEKLSVAVRDGYYAPRTK